jgi:hypothetical protein
LFIPRCATANAGYKKNKKKILRAVNLIKLPKKRGHLIMLRALFFAAGCLLFHNVQSQQDSVPFNPDRPQADMVFMDYWSLRHLSGISKEQLQGKMDKRQLDFISKVLSVPVFQYEASGSIHTANSKEVYAYFQNNTFYINYEGEFYRVPVFGSIAFFVANVKVMRTYVDPRFGFPSSTGYTYELREFLMDVYTGNLEEFNLKRAGELISRDAELGAEYNKLSHRKKKDATYHYIRTYNQKHPFYFLKG